ncbi:MAG: ATP-binding protein [Myxococcota bacterium]
MKKELKERRAKEERVFPKGVYKSDLEYLNDEFEWLVARAERIVAEYKLKHESRARKKSERTVAFDDDYLDNVWKEWERDERVGGGKGGCESRRFSKKALLGLKEREQTVRKRIDERLKLTRSNRRELAMDSLCRIYGLNEQERTILLLAAAPCISGKYETLVFLPLNSLCDRGRVHNLLVETIFLFLEFETEERVKHKKMFGHNSPLFLNGLAIMHFCKHTSSEKDFLISEIEITSRTFRYLTGDETTDDDFFIFSSVEEPRATFENVVINPDDRRKILSVIENHDAYLKYRKEWGFDEVIKYGRGVFMLFYGPPGTGKTMTAHAVAHHLGKKIFNVDVPVFLSTYHDADEILPSLFREAKLQNSVLFFDECEELLQSRRRGNHIVTALLREIERFEGVAMLATNLPETLDEALDRRVLVRVRFDMPDKEARREIWRKHLPESAPLGDDVNLDALASQFEMTGGYIKNAVLMAVADAVHSQDKEKKLAMAHFEKAAKEQMNKISENKGLFIKPRVSLEKVILPDKLHKTIREIIETTRNRSLVFQKWGIGRELLHSEGVSALFYGEPGTGKTLCAEAIAKELNRPLLAISIPALVSKWVGDTEKNIQSVFEQAKAESAVLFFDECDSLLIGRDAPLTRRYEISAVNVFLQMVERHNGIVILATNLANVLDFALIRRISCRVQFPFPNANLRARIWKALLPETAPLEGEIDFAALGRKFDMAGGYIKNAVLKAAFRAANNGGRISQALLEEAADEEVKTIINKTKTMGFGS